jgi:hypothetical protein
MGNSHSPRIPTQTPHILRLTRRHTHQTLEICHIRGQLRELGLQV